MKKQERPFVVKTLLKCLALLAFALPLAFASCSSSSDGDDDWDWDDEDFDPDLMELCVHVCKVANNVADIYMECNSIEELEKYAEDIKDMRYVEDVYFTNTTMFVEIKDYGPVMYSFFPKEDNFDIDDMMESTVRTRDDHPMLGLKKAVVINQTYQDEKFDRTRYASNQVLDLFNAHGIEAKPRNDAGLDFYKDEIFDYDLIYIMTHGSYNPNRKCHFLYTKDSPSEKETATLDPEYAHPYMNYARDEVRLAMLKETRGGEEVGIWYLAISEFYIQNYSTKEFKNPAIVYCGACETMKGPGNNIVNGVPTDTIDKSMARVFAAKKAGMYLGFDESNSIGEQSGLYFFQRLLSGMSLVNSYEDLPDKWKRELNFDTKDYLIGGSVITRIYWADLIPHYNVLGSHRIKKPLLDEKEDLSTDKNIEFVLRAKSILHFLQMKYTQVSYDKVYWYTSPYYDEKDFKYGFDISDNKDFNNAKRLKMMKVGDAGCELNEDYEVKFSQTLTNDELKPLTTYYYRAFFYDGYDYYYSDYDSFTTNSLPVDGNTQLPNVPGSDF